MKFARLPVVVALLLLAGATFASGESGSPVSERVADILAESPEQGKPVDPLESLVKLDGIDLVIQRGMAQGLVAGGVVLAGNRSGILFERAYGRVSPAADAAPVQADATFDLASLTKVLATSPSILKLAEQGKLSLVDRLDAWFPEFGGSSAGNLLVVNLLTHTSGLDDINISSQASLESAINGALTQTLKGEPGHRFKYADINFILLGEVVNRAAGISLDQFALAEFYLPLGMKQTRFLPDAAAIKRCAATLDSSGKAVFGSVQDYNCRLLGGVAGHAGLFSNARDLARFCRMLLNGGELDGKRVLQERTVQQMTVPYFSLGGKVVRGLGWDMESPYSSPKGAAFSEYSYGHTGYSGTSIWIDPARDLYVIFLSVRLDYRNIRAFSQLRRDVSSRAVELFSPRANAGQSGGDDGFQPTR